MKKLVCVGACYLDTILDVPHYPDEDSKLRATNLHVRRGGNCPNTLEVLQQLLKERGGHHVKPYLMSCLPCADAPATATVVGSFGHESVVDFTRCIYRADHTEPARSYIMRSDATGSRTSVNYNSLPEMTIDEFVAAANEVGDDAWFHFEGRIPDTTLQCIRYLRQSFPKTRVSVEVEKPGRSGLEDLAAEADVVFYSRSWAESKRYQNAQQCLKAQSGVAHRATVGAGDTFIAGMLFGLLCHHEDWDMETKVQFAVQLATRKVQQDGFDGVGAGVM
ncbi:Ribokinase-like protein [Hypoxylon cercidicola]|nr:Ribokinase-like protein [Hypoxylon cercidicola]